MIATKSGGVWSDQLICILIYNLASSSPRFLETKLILRTSLETQGRSRLYYLRFPTMSSEYWPQIHELFLKDELKTKLSGLKMLETAGTRAKLCAFTYNCLLLWGKTSSSILFSTPALDGNHLQLS